MVSLSDLDFFYYAAEFIFCEGITFGGGPMNDSVANRKIVDRTTFILTNLDVIEFSSCHATLKLNNLAEFDSNVIQRLLSSKFITIS